MKLSILSLSLALAFSTTCSISAAGTAADTVVTVDNAHKVVITEGSNSISVKIDGAGTNKEYKYNYHSEYAPNATVNTEQSGGDWNFDFPFVKKKDKNESGQKRHKGSVEMSGLMIGMVSGLAADPGVDIKMGNSWEIGVQNLVAVTYTPWVSGPTFSLGMGLTAKKYRMNGETRFMKDGTHLGLGSYPTGMESCYSQLTVGTLDFPLLVRQTIYKQLAMRCGVILDLNTSAQTQTKYKHDGIEYIEKGKNLRQNKVTYSLMGSILLHGCGFYVKYSPCNVMKSGYGPQFKPLSAGLVVMF